MRLQLPLSQLKRILCEADGGIKGLVDEIVAAIKDQYDDCYVDIDRPEKLSSETFIIDVYHEFERGKKTPTGRDKELRAIVKSAVWLFAGEEPVIKLTPKEIRMTTRDYRVYVCRWSGGYVQINVEPKLNLSSMSLKENTVNETDVSSKELVDELVTALNDNYVTDQKRHPFVVRTKSHAFGYMLEMWFANPERTQDREELRALIKSVMWMFTGEEPKTHIPVRMSMKSNSCVEFRAGDWQINIHDNEWVMGHAHVYIEREDLIESALHETDVGFSSDPIEELISELKEHFQAEYGEDSVKQGKHTPHNEFLVIFATLPDEEYREAQIAWEGFLTNLESVLWMATGEKPGPRRGDAYAELGVGRFVLKVSASRTGTAGDGRQTNRYAIIEVYHYPEVSRDMTEAVEEFSEIEEVLSGVFGALFERAEQYSSGIENITWDEYVGGPKGFMVPVRRADVDTVSKQLVNYAKQMFTMLTTGKPILRKTKNFHDGWLVEVPGYRVNIMYNPGPECIVVWVMTYHKKPRRKPVKESVKSRKAFYLMPEVKAEVLDYLGRTFGTDKVKMSYDGAVNLSINVKQTIDDATMGEVSNEIAGLLQMYTGEEATVDKKINWTRDGWVYVLKTKVFTGHVVEYDKGFNVSIGTDDR